MKLSTSLPRAPRFSIHMVLRYRLSGNIAWHEGTTENISRSGVLFRGKQLLEQDTRIEMSFVLPVKVFNQPAAEIICSGLIVRTIPSSGTETLPALGAKILDYYFLRGRQGPSALGPGAKYEGKTKFF